MDSIQKLRVGTVLRTSLEKTVVVQVERLARNRGVKKYLKKRKKYLVHDERKECRSGDRVEIVETRPLSAKKRWRVLKVLTRGEAVVEPAGEGGVSP